MVNSIGMTLKLIPAGEFDMGTSPEQIDLLLKQFPATPKAFLALEQPRHHVRITRPFYLGATEVTRGQFRRFVEAEGYRTVPERDGKGGQGVDLAQDGRGVGGPRYTWRYLGYPQPDDHPVVNVTWSDAVAFCAWLTRTEGIVYRLPTEAEWEYACRAGTTSLYTTGDDPDEIVNVGNVGDASYNEKYPDYVDYATKLTTLKAARDGYVFTAPVGRFPPNPFGVFDMIGNVGEYCSDRFAPDYYRNSPVDDPVGPSLGATRVFRGSNYRGPAAFCRPANRSNAEDDFRRNIVGFRVARDVIMSKR
jgi:formylglycine-generating enzyme required for sulfatase activity